MLQYNIKQYIFKIMMSNYPILLVEGRDDRRFFKYLVEDYIVLNHLPNETKILIDIADGISNSNPLSNREKVEAVADAIKEETFKHRFLGFVDREFRDFEIGKQIKDKLRLQRILDRLVWSRGHSIENYLFDFSILRKPLRDFSVSDYFDTALDLMEKSFESILHVGCAYSIAAYKTELISATRNAMSWEVLKYNNGAVNIDVDILRNILMTHIKLDSRRTIYFIEEYDKWFEIVKKADIDVVKWVTHGHIGLKTIWAAYGLLIGESTPVDEKQGEIQKVLKADESVRFNACVSSWSSTNFGPNEDSPVACIQLLLRDN